LIFFHANAEDVGLSKEFIECICSSLNVHVIAPEYPGYSIYKSEDKCNEEIIKKDADCVFDYLTNSLKIKHKDIILMGRSLGSGPSTYLASKHDGILATI